MRNLLSRKNLLVLTLAVLPALGFNSAQAADTPKKPKISNGLALTPPMGWSSWNNFAEHINEQLLIETIDAMVSSGMRDAGYTYVNLDDGWQRHKGPRSQFPLEVDPEKFPRGIKYLSDYAHSKGLKLGIYSGPGQTTCAGYTGSEGHEKQDAAMFASWGVDHLKYDSCCSHKDAPVPILKTIFGDMSKALMSQKRAQTNGIVLHACHCGWGNIWEWAADLGINHWRIGQDLSDDFDYPANREGYYFDILDMLDRGVGLEQYSGPGHWNDYDMMVVGLAGKRNKDLVGAGASNVEYRTHFSLWAIVNSPLLTGTDIRTMDAYTKETLTNQEIIALNQDALGTPATRVSSINGLEIFAKELSDGSWAIALLNRGSATADITVNLRKDLHLPWSKYRVRDLWQHTDLGTYDIPYTAEVISHETKVFRVYEVKNAQ